MTIKIIDLFNKIANNEEIPEYIKIKNLKYQRQWSDYCGDEPICDLYVAIDKNNFKTLKDFSLDDEIEIIEDTPKEIDLLELLTDTGNNMYLVHPKTRSHIYLDSDESVELVVEQQNELAKAVNYLLKKDKEGE